jgi:HEAT repeat protein
VGRRFGDETFSALVAVVVTAEAGVLLVLVFLLGGRAAGLLGPSGVRGTLLASIVSVSVGLIVLTAYLLAYQGISHCRELALERSRSRWVGVWLDVLYMDREPPPPPLQHDAVAALLDVRETLKGAEGHRVAQIVDQYALGERFARRMRAPKISARLEAIEALAQARIPSALPDLISLIADPEQIVRVAAARAGVRTLAAVPPGPDRDVGAAHLIQALETNQLPRGVVEEILLLGEDAAPQLVGELLLRLDVPVASLKAGLNAAGRLQLFTFTDELVRFVDHPDPEIRAAAFRAFRSIGYLPPEAEPAVIAALDDPVEFVRIHASRAARLLDMETALPILWNALGDPSWWVRRAAARSLVNLGDPGRRELAIASAAHPDRYARDMASQVLRDAAASLTPTGGPR